MKTAFLMTVAIFFSTNLYASCIDSYEAEIREATYDIQSGTYTDNACYNPLVVIFTLGTICAINSTNLTLQKNEAMEMQELIIQARMGYANNALKEMHARIQPSKNWSLEKLRNVIELADEDTYFCRNFNEPVNLRTIVSWIKGGHLDYYAKKYEKVKCNGQHFLE